MSDGDARDKGGPIKKGAKVSKKSDEGATLLAQWRTWNGLDPHAEIGFDDIRKYLAHIQHVLDSKVPLRELPMRLGPIRALLEVTPTEDSASTVPPREVPRIGNHATGRGTPTGLSKEPAVGQQGGTQGDEYADLKKALEKLANRMESVATRVESIDSNRHFMLGKQNEIREALAGIDGRLAATQEGLHPDKLANPIGVRLGSIERRLSSIESNLKEALDRLASSFTFDDATRIGQLRRDLEREVGPNIRNDISRLLAPIVSSFDELVASNRLDESSMKGIVAALRERAIKAGLTMDLKRVL